MSSSYQRPEQRVSADRFDGTINLIPKLNTREEQETTADQYRDGTQTWALLVLLRRPFEDGSDLPFDRYRYLLESSGARSPLELAYRWQSAELTVLKGGAMA